MDDNYPNVEDQTDQTGDDTGTAEAQTDAGDESSTGLLPKSFFADDVKPGDRCTIELVRCHDEDCEVKYVSKEGSSTGGSSMENAQGRLAAMASG